MSGFIAPPEAVPFLDALDRIEAERPPRALRLTTAFLALLIIAVLLTASVARIDNVVTGRGRLSADHPTAVLQPLERAIIRTMRVRAGDRVRRGDVLATLDPTAAEADLAALRARGRALTAQTARLQAEAEAADYDPGAAPTAEATLQASLFAQRQREFNARRASFDQAIAHDEAARATIEGQRAALMRQVQIAADVRHLRETLMRGAVGSRLQYLDADAALARGEGDLQSATNRLAELAHEGESHRADRRAFIETWRRDVLDTLAASRTSLAETEAAITKAAHLQDLISVTAPEDGVVLDISPRAPGSTLGDGEPLLTLLPAYASMQAELTIKSADIGYIREGDEVTLKIDAYPFQRHGSLTGRVRSIEAASFDPQGSRDPLAAGAVHRVAVDITQPALTDLPAGTGPMPGMTLSGDVKVGTRTVLAYFLTPITRGLRQSLREP